LVGPEPQPCAFVGRPLHWVQNTRGDPPPGMAAHAPSLRPLPAAALAGLRRISETPSTDEVYFAKTLA
jgi:hypothetical protein